MLFFKVPEKLRVWFVLAGLIMVQAGFTGVGVNCISVLFAAILKDTGFLTGELFLYYTVSGLVSAACLSWLTRRFFAGRGLLLLAILGVVSACGIGMMSLFTHVWQWYIAAAFAGIGGSLCPVVVPVMVNNWFPKKTGLINGAVMASSGLAGALLSPLCSAFTERFGWRQTALFLMAMLLLAVIPSCLLAIRVVPPDTDDMKQEPTVRSGAVSFASPALPAKEQCAPRWLPVLLLAILLIPMIIVQLCFQVPTYAQSLGYTPMVGGYLASLLMIGNVGGKLTFGMLADKIGIYNTARGAFILSGLALLLLARGNRIPGMLYAGSLLLGIIYSLATVVIILLCLDIYGPVGYRNHIGRINAVIRVGAAFSGPLIAYSYDRFGAYQPVMLICAALCGGAVLFLFVLQFGRRRMAIAENVTE